MATEISLLRRELVEAKNIHARENDLLREALRHEKRRYVEVLQQFGCCGTAQNSGSNNGSNNTTTTGEDSGIVDFQTVEEQRLNLQQKMAMLQDSNNMLLKEKDQLLQRMRQQEQTLASMELRLETSDGFSHQLEALRSERDFLLKQVDLAGESQKTIHDLLNQKKFLEEALRTEKALVMEVRRQAELVDLEKQKANQEAARAKRRAESLERELQRADDDRKKVVEDGKTGLSENDLLQQQQRYAETMELQNRQLSMLKMELKKEKASRDSEKALFQVDGKKWEMEVKDAHLKMKKNEIDVQQNMETKVTTIRTSLEQSYMKELTSTRKDLEKQHVHVLAKLRKELGLEHSVKENRLVRSHEDVMNQAQEQHLQQVMPRRVTFYRL